MRIGVKISLGIIMSHFESSLLLFWDRYRKSELDQLMVPELETFFSNFRDTPVGGRLALKSDLRFSRPTYTVDHRWNQVLNLVPSGPEAESLAAGHHGSKENWKTLEKKNLTIIIKLQKKIFTHILHRKKVSVALVR
ncbi:hypothetical protein AVEN_103944-1 [Araneus ventricosus]|uniref:Uncharacterized protein n=1 Tax=Araneus ventricosus TaxID=182803 RepID=A0A4Y2I759_ARAVE|nr:hypothetical protein AVEN_103944-1 [Araneus ventricosus]